MSLQCCRATLTDIRKGRFSLNHDCILQVYFRNGLGLRYQFFSCRSQDSGELISLFTMLYFVSKVVAIPVDDFKFNHK